MSEEKRSRAGRIIFRCIWRVEINSPSPTTIVLGARIVGLLFTFAWGMYLLLIVLWLISIYRRG